MRFHLAQHGVYRHKIGVIQGGDIPTGFHHEVAVSVLRLNGILQFETSLAVDADPEQVKAFVLAVQQKGVHLGNGHLDGQVLGAISYQEEGRTRGVLQVAVITANGQSGKAAKCLSGANTQAEEQRERTDHRSI